MSTRKIVGGLSLAVALCIVGCGPTIGSVNGTVTYGNKQLKGGTVVLMGESGAPTYSTLIESDGTYKIENVRTGTYKVLVDTAGLKGSLGYNMSGPPGSKVSPKKGAGVVKNEPPPGANVPEGYKMGNPANQQREESLKRYVQIPLKYSKFEDTSLTLEVKGGAQEYKIQLVD